MPTPCHQRTLRNDSSPYCCHRRQRLRWQRHLPTACSIRRRHEHQPQRRPRALQQPTGS
jgi:hypothetical protein